MKRNCLLKNLKKNEKNRNLIWDAIASHFGTWLDFFLVVLRTNGERWDPFGSFREKLGGELFLLQAANDDARAAREKFA